MASVKETVAAMSISSMADSKPNHIYRRKKNEMASYQEIYKY
ncbi:MULTISPECIES: hypothetical protein [unclassified Polaribacter]|nr:MULTISPECIES: hypothetical protein [unclassified Polaribacter]